ncbi:MAG: DUF4924 family protein [Bacteroidales bacterium]|nr:DUF4924 family protein [Bacteroidales bacterium]
MIVAKEKRENNIAEYLLYMWQVEDIIRACNFDIALINANIVEQYDVAPDVKSKISEWYENLIEMMRNEGKLEKGHLQINTNVIIKLNDLHSELLASQKMSLYTAAFYKALPYINEIKNKQGNTKCNDIETAFNSLYGLLLLRLSKREVSDETIAATKTITQFLSQLAELYKKEKAGELEL